MSRLRVPMRGAGGPGVLLGWGFGRAEGDEPLKGSLARPLIVGAPRYPHSEWKNSFFFCQLNHSFCRSC
jgi:hypothetical protein